MRLSSVLLVLSVSCFASYAADACDCSHFPIKPTACVPECLRDRLNAAADVLASFNGAPDKSVPQELIAKAECVVIVPGVKKASFTVGAQYGHGFAVCRRGSGSGWTAPAAIRMEGGSFGFQLGVSGGDLLLLVMNRSGVKRLLGNKSTLGDEATVAAGPVGREGIAQTDALMHAEVLSYARSAGSIAGISLLGATIRPDDEVNQQLYGQAVSNREVLTGEVKATAAASKLEAVLSRDLTRTAR